MSIIFSSENPQARAKPTITQTVDVHPQKAKAVQYESFMTKRTAGIALGTFAILGTAIAGYYGYHYLSGANMPRLDSSQNVVLPKQSYLPVQPFCSVPNLWDDESFPHERNMTTLLTKETFPVKDHLTAQPFCPSLNPQEKLCFPSDRNLTLINNVSPSSTMPRNFTTVEPAEKPRSSSTGIFTDITSTLFKSDSLSYVSNLANQTFNTLAPIIKYPTERLKTDRDNLRHMQIGGFNGTQILSGVSQLFGAGGGYLTVDVISKMKKFSNSKTAFGIFMIGYLESFAVFSIEKHEYTRLALSSATGAAFTIFQKLLSHSCEQLNRVGNVRPRFND